MLRFLQNIISLVTVYSFCEWVNVLSITWFRFEALFELESVENLCSMLKSNSTINEIVLVIVLGKLINDNQTFELFSSC